ncbi:MAG: LVIVD repeat-containing protein, partial [Planctomycetota bacterium]
MGSTGRSVLCMVLAALWLAAPVEAGNDPPFNAELIGTWDGFNGSYADVWADGQTAYLGQFGDAGVLIVDISDPANPSGFEYQLPPPNQGASAQDVKVGDDLLFVALEGNNDASVHIVDVRDPMNPVAVVDIAISGFTHIHNTFYDNGFLYMADSSTTRVGIVDLTSLDPDDPPAGPITDVKWMVENIGTSFVHDMTVADGRLYAAAWDSGLWI